MVVECREVLPRGPVLFVANHSSHVDTAAILRALPSWMRARTAPGAAADHFFRGRLRGAAVSLLVGAFPFPRSGGLGLDRCRELIAEGWSVLLYPSGSRTGGRFRPGAASLAASGVTVVPVGIEGTAAILPKGRWLPRRGAVRVRFGEPFRVPLGSDVLAVSRRLERAVRDLAGEAGEEPRERGSGSTVPSIPIGQEVPLLRNTG
jgi:1-acyl-sn-glycerol-3-phosphate acyltransferase